MLQLPATPATLLSEVIYPALVLLPSNMDTSDAHALLLAIAGQESNLEFRRQQVNGGKLGPARSPWQFEETGVRGVLTHHASDDLAAMVCRAAKLAPVTRTVHRALELPQYDQLACQLARLLLWTDAKPLPRARYDAESEAFGYYVRNWRPGACATPEGRAKCAKRWTNHWRAAVEAVS